MINVTFKKQRPHQRWVHEKVQKHLNSHNRGSDDFQKVITILAPRQVGKTICLIEVLLYFAGLYKGGKSIYISPTLGQARDIMRTILSKCSQIVKTSNKSDLFIEFINGSLIKFGSADQADNLRGNSVYKGVLIIDEAAYVSDDFYTDVAKFFVNAHRELTIISSTPEYKQGFFYESFIRGIESGYSIDFSGINLDRYQNQTEKAADRLRLSKNSFNSQWLGIFKDADSSVFGDFTNCLIPELVPIDKCERVYLGVDFGTGTGGDYTVVTGVNEKVKMCYLWYSNTQSITQQVEHIAFIAKELGAKLKDMWIEENSIGKAFKELLYQKKIDFVPKTTTAHSKMEWVEYLTILIETGALGILDNIELKKQLNSFSRFVTGGSNVRYAAKDGHDDMVMSLMLACQCRKNWYDFLK
jgi:hypothetical protein